jgi:8-oxo-dGTP pyrophosphatase MutT (NUDIX family)
MINTLFQNQWLSLKEVVAPPNIKGYVFSHETRSNGSIVSILPYRELNGKTQFLLRKEITPCWDDEEPNFSSITGGIEDISQKRQTVINEIKEEAGYEVSKQDLMFLGTCRGSKSSDTTYYLYSVDLSDKKQGDAVGDGSELERLGSCVWFDDISESVDSLSYVSFYRLNARLKEKS